MCLVVVWVVESGLRVCLSGRYVSGGVWEVLLSCCVWCSWLGGRCSGVYGEVCVQGELVYAELFGWVTLWEGVVGRGEVVGSCVSLVPSFASL